MTQTPSDLQAMIDKAVAERMKPILKENKELRELLDVRTDPKRDEPLGPYNDTILDEVHNITDDEIRDRLTPFLEIAKTRQLTGEEWNGTTEKPGVAYTKAMHLATIVTTLRFHEICPESDYKILRAFYDHPNMFRLFEYGSRFKNNAPAAKGWSKTGLLYVYSMFKADKQQEHPDIKLISRIERWKDSEIGQWFRTGERGHMRMKPFEYGILEFVRQSLLWDPRLWEYKARNRAKKKKS